VPAVTINGVDIRNVEFPRRGLDRPKNWRQNVVRKGFCSIQVKTSKTGLVLGSAPSQRKYAWTESNAQNNEHQGQPDLPGVAAEELFEQQTGCKAPTRAPARQ